MQPWYANQVIGDVFVKMAAFMKVYTNYVKNFNAALSCIQVFLSLAMIVVVCITNLLIALQNKTALRGVLRACLHRDGLRYCRFAFLPHHACPTYPSLSG